MKSALSGYIASLLAFLMLGSCAVDTKLTGHTRIVEASFVSIGGIQQWVTIRGDDRRRPVLLIVHGGPADPQSPLVNAYAPYEREFVVVQWDQRGAGKSFAANRHVVQELTLDRMAQDGVELVEYLCRHLAHKKIIVLGHSWGSTLATAMVQRKPQLFAAYVGTGQVSSWSAAAAAQWKHLLLAATAANDQATLDRMQTIGKPNPFNTAEYFSWRNIMNRKYLGAADAAWLQNLRSMAPTLFTEAELKDQNEAANFSGQQLMKVMMSTDLGKSAKDMPVPFFVIQGRDDLYTPTAPAVEYFNSVQAPKKKLIILENAGHFALTTHGQEFLQSLKSFGLSTLE